MKSYLPYMLLLASITLLTGCYNAIEQQYEYGNYTTVIRSSLEKVKKSRKRDQYIDMALRAYDKGMADDKSKIEYLKRNNADGSNWGKIYYTYQSMVIKQESVEPHLPLKYSDGSTVPVELYDLRDVVEEARQNAAEYHYSQAETWLKEDSRLAGRNAYSHLGKIRHYYLNRTYRDENTLRDQAIEMGTNKVLIIFKPNSGIYLPDSYLDELSYYDYENCLGGWTRLYRDPGNTNIYDYAIEVTVESINISPEHIREIHYDKTKEVEDGVKPLLDADGEFVTDSSGNILQVTNYTTLTCHVTEWSQHRSANVITAFEIYDMRDQRLSVHQQLEDHVVFENIYARANGHLNILPNDIKALVNNYPKPFPTDHDMILMTSESLKKQIARAISENDYVLAGL